MLKIKKVKHGCKVKTIRMGDMKPLQVGRLEFGGNVVMRTSNSDVFEVMDLSNPQANACWDVKNDNLVELLPKGESITIKLFN